MQILSEAAEELESGKDAIRRTGLTQKLYYSRLTELKRLGLVERQGIKTYRATPRGRLILDLRKRFGEALNQRRTSLPVESRVIATYPEMVETLSTQMDRARSRIKLATRYVDTTIAKCTFDALGRNVSIQVIYKSGKTHLGRMALELLGLVKRDVGSQVNLLWRNTRVSDIPFSFSIVDGHWSGIELVGPDDTFIAALEFEGEAAAAALGVLFRHYYRVGSVFPRFW